MTPPTPHPAQGTKKLPERGGGSITRPFCVSLACWQRFEPGNYRIKFLKRNRCSKLRRRNKMQCCEMAHNGVQWWVSLHRDVNELPRSAKVNLHSFERFINNRMSSKRRRYFYHNHLGSLYALQFIYQLFIINSGQRTCFMFVCKFTRHARLQP